MNQVHAALEVLPCFPIGVMGGVSITQECMRQGDRGHEY